MRRDLDAKPARGLAGLGCWYGLESVAAGPWLPEAGGIYARLTGRAPVGRPSFQQRRWESRLLCLETTATTSHVCVSELRAMISAILFRPKTSLDKEAEEVFQDVTTWFCDALQALQRSMTPCRVARCLREGLSFARCCKQAKYRIQLPDCESGSERSPMPAPITS